MAQLARSVAPSIRVERSTLANGLRVVFGPDRSSPATFVAVYYDVGIRSEPEGKSGFAHLFEHLMFEGSTTLEKGLHDRIVSSSGGVMNGSTWSDYTNYYELMPSNALEVALFLEADRMRGIRLNEENLRNQVDVVKEEVKNKIHNQPYASFASIEIIAALFDSFANKHDGWGDFKDLDAATLDDARAFFDRYYAPGNAVLSVAGDFDVDEAARMVERHFGDIPARAVPPTPDASESVPKKERRVVSVDRLAPEPAIGLAYRVPDPMTQIEDHFAMVLLSSILIDGEASRLFLRLVKKERLASHLSGHHGLQSGSFDARGPIALRIMAFYPGEPNADRICKAIDEEIERIAGSIEEEEVQRFRNAYLADFLRRADNLEDRGQLLAALEQQRARAEMIGEIPAALARVGAKDVSRVAAEWLRPQMRAVVDLRPGAGA